MPTPSEPMTEAEANSFLARHRLRVEIECQHAQRGTSLWAESEVAEHCAARPDSREAWDIRNSIHRKRVAAGMLGHTNLGPWEGGFQWLEDPRPQVVPRARKRRDQQA